MKIGQLGNNHKLVAPTADARKSALVEASAKVERSAAASLLATEDNNADFDAGKVARMARAIRDGKFQIEADAIADKLLTNTRERLRRPRPGDTVQLCAGSLRAKVPWQRVAWMESGSPKPRHPARAAVRQHNRQETPPTRR